MKIVRFMMIGFLISLSSSYIIMTLRVIAVPNATVTGEHLAKQLCVAAILGIFIGISSMIFELERIPVLLQLIFHYTTVSTFVIVAGYFGEWYTLSQISTVIKILLYTFVIYGITWLILRVVIMQDIEHINQKIQQRKRLYNDNR